MRPDTPGEPDRVFLKLENVRTDKGSGIFDVGVRPRQNRPMSTLALYHFLASPPPRVPVGPWRRWNDQGARGHPRGRRYDARPAPERKARHPHCSSRRQLERRRHLCRPSQPRSPFWPMRAAAAALRCLTEGPDWPLLAVAGLAWVILLAADQSRARRRSAWPEARPDCVSALVAFLAGGMGWGRGLVRGLGRHACRDDGAAAPSPLKPRATICALRTAHTLACVSFSRPSLRLGSHRHGLDGGRVRLSASRLVGFRRYWSRGRRRPDLARRALQADRPQSKPCAAAPSRLRRAGRRGCNALWRPVRRLVRRLVLAIDARADDRRRRASRDDGRRSRAHAV